MNNIITKKQLKEFGFIIGLGFPFIFGLLIPFLNQHAFRIWTIYFGITFLLLAIFFPNLLFFPYKLWMKIGHVLGWINSRIILGLIFILILQPIALIMKIFKYDPLRLKKVQTSSYKELKKGNHRTDLNKIF